MSVFLSESDAIRSSTQTESSRNSESVRSVFRQKNHCRSKSGGFYTERTGTAESPHPVDVLGALDGELCQSGDVELSAAVRVHLDVQLVGEILPQQVPDRQQRHSQPADMTQGSNYPHSQFYLLQPAKQGGATVSERIVRRETFHILTQFTPSK